MTGEHPDQVARILTDVQNYLGPLQMTDDQRRLWACNVLNAYGWLDLAVALRSVEALGLPVTDSLPRIIQNMEALGRAETLDKR